MQRTSAPAVASGVALSVALGAVLAATAGCDAVFGLDPGPAKACSLLPYDPARYWSIPGLLFGTTWSNARTLCARRGMDLAVLDEGDGEELAAQSAGAPVPFWLGVSYGDGWTAIDGCAPYLSWAPGEPATEAPGTCVTMGNSGMVATPCGFMAQNSTNAVQVLCETPRPDQRCRELDATSTYQLGATVAVDYAAAEAMCAAMDMHVLELNSSAELQRIRAEFPGMPRYWLGARFAADQWITPTGCPLVFPWTGSSSEAVAGVCALQDDAAIADPGTKIVSCTTTARVLCERNGG